MPASGREFKSEGAAPIQCHHEIVDWVGELKAPIHWPIVVEAIVELSARYRSQ
jgi:hypothetical protein